MNLSAHGQQQSQLTIWEVLRVSKSLRGRLSRMDSVPHHITRKIVNLEDFNTAGNTKRPPELRAISGIGT